MNEKNENEMINVGMQIILTAGDCRNYVKMAGDKILEKNLKAAEELIQKAEENLIKAHRLQTQILQQNIAGEVNILFAHAQDTLMCSQSELWLIQFLLKFAKVYVQE